MLFVGFDGNPRRLGCVRGNLLKAPDTEAPRCFKSIRRRTRALAAGVQRSAGVRYPGDAVSTPRPEESCRGVPTVTPGGETRGERKGEDSAPGGARQGRTRRKRPSRKREPTFLFLLFPEYINSG